MISEYAIKVLFLEPQKRDFVVNRITAYIGGLLHGARDGGAEARHGFCHVEICIPQDDDENHHVSVDERSSNYLSSSIYNGETVSLTHSKSFGNPGYTIHTMAITASQLKRIRAYIYQHHEGQTGFDAVGMYMAVLPFQVGSHGSCVVCFTALANC